MYPFKEYLNSFQRNDSLVNNLMLVYRYHIVPIDASKHSTCFVLNPRIYNYII